MNDELKLTNEFSKDLNQKYVKAVFLLFIIGILAVYIFGVEINTSSGMILIAALGFGVYQYWREKRSWSTYRITISPTQITRKRDGFEPVMIGKDDVTKISLYQNGYLAIWGETSSRPILVPDTLESFSELKDTLGNWKEIETART